MWGKGLNNSSIASMKNGNFISEPQTDFIFAVVGEELGFIGCVIVIVLLLLIVFECILIAKNAKDLGGRLICCGMAADRISEFYQYLCNDRSDAKHRIAFCHLSATV